MEPEQHWTHLREQGRAMAAAARGVPHDTAVPSCPAWDLGALLRHTGGVHRWATDIVANARPDRPAKPDGPEAGTAERDVLAWFDEGLDGLLTALTTAPPDLECFTFHAAPSPLAMWSRRMAHETTIHRVDAELVRKARFPTDTSPDPISPAPDPISPAPDPINPAPDPISPTPDPIDPALAADGVEEVLHTRLTRPGRGPSSDVAYTIGFTATDLRAAWFASVGPDGYALIPDGEPTADVMVRGGVATLYLLLWNRVTADDASVTVTGARSLLDHWSAAIAT